MTKFKVTIELDLNGEKGVNEVEIEAAAIYYQGNVLEFSSDARDSRVNNILAIFPVNRVISVIREGQ